MNEKQQRAINAVCHLFPVVRPKGDPDEQTVRDMYERVMSDECTCEIERIKNGTVRDVCRKCGCKVKLETAWPFLAEPT